MLRRLMKGLLARGRRFRPDAFDVAREAIAARDWAAAEARIAELRGADAADRRLPFLEAELRRRKGDAAGAMPLYRRALALDQRLADGWAGLGDCAARLGDPVQALHHYRAALFLAPDRADILNEVGVARLALGNRSSAAEAFERAVGLEPRLPDAWNNAGVIAASSGHLELARRHFHRAAHLRPDFYMALCNLGLACRDLGRDAEARDALERATKVAPGRADAWLNLGLLAQDEGEPAHALEHIRRACEADPASLPARTALGIALSRTGAHDEAERVLAGVLAASPDDPEANLGLAHLDLLRARWGAGWDRYEHRLRAAQSPRRRYLVREWGGRGDAADAFDGRSMLVYAEQGLGDTILFASCLPDLLARAKDCVIDCEDRLWPLLSRSFPALVRYDPRAPASVDGAIPVGSLPRAFRRDAASFPRHTGYLRADPSRVESARSACSAQGPGLRVGLSWRGGLRRTGEAIRSLQPGDLAPLLSLPGVHWFSLQHGADPAEIERVSAATGTAIRAMPGSTSDPDALAAAIGALDLVVTVCNSVVHLSGALGRDAFVLVPDAPSWRYGDRGDAMPWYPSARLFRQARGEDWSGAVARLRAALEQRMRP